jgi:hypothetical protein
MNKLIPFFLLSVLWCSVSAQNYTVSGRVTDKSTGLPLTGASVVCQSTTIGTTTNAEGQFTLQLPQGGYALAVSFSGYETWSIRINAQTENIRNLEATLKLRDRSMDEVSITVSNEVRDGWAKYGGFLQEQFLGMGPNSGKCRIENPESLRFFFSKKKNRLKVTTREDLRIRNEALGYTIRYQLDSFVHEYANGATLFTGFPFFEDIQGSAVQESEWNANREKAYYGSLLHFMRCYYDSTLGDNGYKIERIGKGDKPIAVKDPYDASIYEAGEDRETDLKLPGRLRVVYSLEKPDPGYLSVNKLSLQTTIQVSILELPDIVSIEENGYYYDQREILTLGYWSWEKVADLLPYDYEPE